MKWIIFGIPLWKIVIIGGFAFFLGFFIAAILASAGMVSRDQERVMKVPVVRTKI